MELVQSLITVVVFIVLLGTLVLVHELGHFITARWAKVRVLEFGIGFPPRAKVLGRGKRPAYDAGRPPRPDPALPPNVEPGSDEAQAFVAAARAQDAEAGATLYTLNWLPIGGFVKLEGEDGDDGADPHSFANAKLWVKVGILLAGVTMNLLLAFALFTGIAMWGEPAVGVTVTEVVPGSPAAEAALEPGDTIATVDGRQYSAFDLQTSNPLIDIRSLAGQTVVLSIVHADGTAEDLTVTLREPATPDPELAFLKSHYRDEVHRALKDALAGLDADERNVLRLHFLDGLSTERIAVVYGVHRATVARWVSRGREALLRGTHQLLTERLRIGRGEVESLIGIVQSQLGLSLSSIFRAG